MGPVIFLTQLALFSILICTLHALKPRLGLAPLFVVIGVFEVFLFVAGKGGLLWVELFSSPPGRGSSIIFVPLILATFVLVYVLEGTREARLLLIGLVAAYLVHGLIDEMLMYLVSNPPPGVESANGNMLFEFSQRSRLSSMGAIVADVVVIIVVYQFTVNRFPRVPSAVPLWAGLVLAMATDAITYTAFNGELIQVPDLYWSQKVQAGAAVGIPVALYLDWQLRRNKDLVKSGILERGSFDIIDLRRQLESQQKRLTQMKESFSRYVSSDVVEQIASDPSNVSLGGEKRDVTVLFADIRGYSTLSEHLDPEKVIDILNQYFGRVGEIILAHQGMINEFEGDAVLAVFGAPNVLADHAERAVSTARDMLAAVERLNREWEADGTADLWREVGIDSLAIRIGVHSGSVVAGNIGSEQRMKYAVIGDTVNTASRVEALNKDLDTSLLLTAQTVSQLQATNGAWKDMGSHAVKGRSEPVHVFTPSRPLSTGR